MDRKHLRAWAGDTPSRDPSWSGEMESWLDTLTERYPVIEPIVESLEIALVANDTLGAQEAFAALVRTLTNRKLVSYPDLTLDEQRVAVRRMISRMQRGLQMIGGHRQTIAISLREAAPKKYERYQRFASRLAR